MKKPGIFKTIAATLFLIAALPSGAAIASQGPEALCDAGLWKQMTQRATLLGQIDTSTVQNLVYKADSVLEYTCFNRFINVAIYYMPYYMTPYYPKDIIQAGVTQYLYQNFGHTYLGGRLNASSAAAPLNEGEYVCNAMTWVWEAAKCINFAQTEPQDSIYDLRGFITAIDIRQKPQACTNSRPTEVYGTVPAIAEIITTGIYVPPSPPGSEIPSESPPPAPNPSTPRPIICGNPIPTGLIAGVVVNQSAAPAPGPGPAPAPAPAPPPTSDPQGYKEKICPNAACNYDPDKDRCDP